MKPLVRAARLIGNLFFDDGRLALGILVLLGCTAVAASAPGSPSWASIALLVGGTLLLLVRSVLRAARCR